MVKLTGWLDWLFEGASRRSGISKEHISAQVGGEIVGNVLEFVSGMFAKGWLKPAVNAIAGVLALGYGLYARDVDDRLRRELLAIGSHLSLSALKEMKSSEVKESLSSFKESLEAGNIEAALSTILATPEEAMSIFAAPTTTGRPVVIVQMPESWSPVAAPPPSAGEEEQGINIPSPSAI
jgi:hypothetical protein